MWIGSDKELNECLPQSIIELSPTLVNFTVESYYKCNAYVHQAKIQPGLCKDDLCDPKLSIMIGGISEQTRASIDFTKYFIVNGQLCLQIGRT